MTYTRLDDMVDREGKVVLNHVETVDRKAYLIILELHGRSGFDAWWDRIYAEDQDDIFEAIKRIIKKEG